MERSQIKLEDLNELLYQSPKQQCLGEGIKLDKNQNFFNSSADRPVTIKLELDEQQQQNQQQQQQFQQCDTTMLPYEMEVQKQSQQQLQQQSQQWEKNHFAQHRLNFQQQQQIQQFNGNKKLSLECGVCGIEFQSLFEYCIHDISVHKDYGLSKILFIDLKRNKNQQEKFIQAFKSINYNTDVCGEDIYSSDYDDDGNNSDDGEDRNQKSENDINAKNQKKKNYIKEKECAYKNCDFKTSSKQLMQYHIEQEHYPYICIDCGKKFLSEKSLKKHIDTTHNNTIPDLKCYYNDKCTFVTKCEKILEQHIQEAHKNFTCPVRGCSYVGDSKKYLQQHMKIKHSSDSNSFNKQLKKGVKMFDLDENEQYILRRISMYYDTSNKGCFQKEKGENMAIACLFLVVNYEYFCGNFLDIKKHQQRIQAKLDNFSEAFQNYEWQIFFKKQSQAVFNEIKQFVIQ